MNSLLACWMREVRQQERVNVGSLLSFIHSDSSDELTMTINTRIDPSQLFNDSHLSLLIPQFSSSNSAPPRSTLPSSPSQTSIDQWIHSLLSSPTRTTSYNDESLEFYLVLSISSQLELNHSQALSFLLQSLPEPHLTLAATISYYEDTSNHPGEQQLNNVSALNPLNKLTSTHDPTTRETIHVMTQPFDEEEGKVWVGKGVERDEWVGVWKFNCPICESVFSTCFEGKA